MKIAQTTSNSFDDSSLRIKDVMEEKNENATFTSGIVKS